MYMRATVPVALTGAPAGAWGHRRACVGVGGRRPTTLTTLTVRHCQRGRSLRCRPDQQRPFYLAGTRPWAGVPEVHRTRRSYAKAPPAPTSPTSKPILRNGAGHRVGIDVAATTSPTLKSSRTKLSYGRLSALSRTAGGVYRHTAGHSPAPGRSHSCQIDSNEMRQCRHSSGV